MSRLKKRRSGSGAVIAEFGPALFVFFMIILFPLINLLALAIDAGTVYLIAKQAASKAAASVTFGDAQLSSEQAAYNIESGGIGKFCHLVPVGGFNGSGLDLYVTETDISSNVSIHNGPNTPNVTNPVDTSAYLYTYDAVVTYECGPLMRLHYIPWIGDIPGVGKPATISYTASEHVEHPEGLETGIPPGEMPDARTHQNNTLL